MSDLMSTSSGGKSFWQKPEGQTGKVFTFLLLGIGGFLVYKYLPAISEWLAVVTSNLLYAGLSFAGLALLIMLATSKQVHTIIWYSFQLAMRSLTGLVVETNPIGIAKSYLADLQTQREKMNDQIVDLKGQMGKLDNQIKKNDYDKTKSLNLVSAAKNLGDQEQMMLNSRQAGRLSDSNTRLSALYSKMDILYKVLDKMFRNAGVLLEDIKGEISVTEQEYNAMKTGWKAFKSALAVANGDPDKKAIFDQAMEFMTDEIGSKVGEMDRFLDQSKSWISKIDLQNAAFETEGLKMLDEMNNKGLEYFTLQNKPLDVLNSGTTQPLAVKIASTQEVNAGKSSFSLEDEIFKN
jgi:hypothetical protein